MSFKIDYTIITNVDPNVDFLKLSFVLQMLHLIFII